MGLLSWLFPSPEQKLERARADLLAGRANDARILALEANLPGSAEVVEQAEVLLCRINLAHAESWAEAGDEIKARQHVDLADQFRHAENDREFGQTLDKIRTLLNSKEQERRAEVLAEEKRRSLVDPRFREDHGVGDMPLPDGISEEDAEIMQTRLALLYENYPESLRNAMFELGPAFSQAVLELEDGQVESARRILDTLEPHPLVLHERARAALATKDLPAAAAAWRSFAEQVGHHPIGNVHTALLLATTEVQLGDTLGALATLKTARQKEPELGGGLYASILEATGEYAGAEAVLRDLLKRFGPQPILYNQIARVRERGGHRMEAMQALETALKACGCAPGKCGPTPPDATTYRMLATLYLEDRIETERALELADTAISMVDQPSWEDLYLATLVARARQDASWTEKAESLRSITPIGVSARDRLERFLSAPA